MTNLAVRNRMTVLVGSFFLLLGGLFAGMSMPQESFPEVKIPLIFVNTVYPGASPEDIENVVTQKIEDKLEGMDGVKKISSQSMDGVSAIQVEFQPTVKVEDALRRVKDKVDQSKADLPKDAEDPLVQELNFSSIPVFVTSLSADYELDRLEPMAEELKDKLKTVNGVLDVKITGKQEKEVAIDCDPVKLKSREVTMDDVVKAINTQHANIPGGVLRNGQNRFSVQLTGELDHYEDFADLVVKVVDGAPVYVRDVATVGFQYSRDRSTIARLDGKPSLAITVTKRTGENLIRIVDDTKKIIEEESKKWPVGTHVDYTMDQSKDIRHMVNELINHIIMGVILVVLSLTFFLGFRNSFFISLAIPLSMMAGFLVLNSMNVTLNMVVLFSLVLALGMLVDDGIVVVENIYRHYNMGKSRVQAAIEGTKEVAIPVTTATLTTVGAFAPIVGMPGIMGQVMKYLPITVAVTLFASLIVAFVVNPVFASLFMTRKDHEKGEEGTFFEHVKHHYGRLLTWIVDRPVKGFLLVSAICTVFFFGSFFAYGATGLGAIFFPESEPKVVAATIEGPVGQELNLSDSAIKILEQKALNIPKDQADLQSVSTVVGKGKDDMKMGGGQSEAHKAYLDFAFSDFEDRKVSSWTTMRWLEDSLPVQLPGWKVNVKKQQNGPPVGKPVSFEISGESFDVLGPIVEKVKDSLKTIAELTNVGSDFDAEQPSIEVHVNREQCKLLGISTSEVARAVRGALHGVEAGKFREHGDEYDIMVRLKPETREKIEGLEQVIIAHEGKFIPLTSVATISQSANLNMVNHLNGQRTVQVWAEMAPGFTNEQAAKDKAAAKIKGIELPESYTLGEGSSNRDRQESSAFIMKALVIAMVAVFFTMVMQFNSIFQPFLVLGGILLAFGGVFWGMVIMQSQFVIIMTGIGIVALAGVVAKNGIVLIDFINHLRQKGLNLRDAVIEGGKTRMRPVVLTAITAMIGLLPMATGMGWDFVHMVPIVKSESSSFWSPMAWAIFWGLLFNTLLVLVVVPVSYAAWYRFTHWLSNKFGRMLKKQPKPEDEKDFEIPPQEH